MNIKIHLTSIRILRLCTTFCIGSTGFRFRMTVTAEKTQAFPCHLIIPDKVQHGQVLFAFAGTKPAPQLLQKDNRRFRRSEEHYQIHRRNIQALIKHIHGKDHPDLFLSQPLNRTITFLRELSIRITVNSHGRNPTLAELSRHLLRVRPGTAETKCPPGMIFPIMLVDQIMAVHISR